MLDRGRSAPQPRTTRLCLPPVWTFHVAHVSYYLAGRYTISLSNRTRESRTFRSGTTLDIPAPGPVVGTEPSSRGGRHAVGFTDPMPSLKPTSSLDWPVGTGLLYGRFPLWAEGENIERHWPAVEGGLGTERETTAVCSSIPGPEQSTLSEFQNAHISFHSRS